MDHELSKQLMTSARERFDRTAKWSTLAITLVALFHIVVFTRYVGLREGAAAAKDELEALDRRTQTLASLTASLAPFNDAITRCIETELPAGLQRIKDDFRAMSEALQSARENKPGDYEIGEPEPRFNPTHQVPNAAVRPPGGRWRFTPEAIEAARTYDEPRFRAAIVLVAEGQIIGPQFERLNASWQSSVVPAARRAAADAPPILQSLIASDKERTLVWSAALAAVTAAAEQVDRVRLAPPADPDWYRTVSAKESAFGRLSQDVSDAFRQSFDSAADFRSLLAAAADARKAKEDKLKQIAVEQQRLADAYKKQSEVLAGLGDPFKFLAADIDYIVPRFPLLIGILLAACAVLSGRALSSLIRTATAAGGPDSGTRLLGLLYRASPLSPFVAAARMTLSAAWVSAAAWSLRAWPGEESDRIRVYLFTALAIVLVAEVYRMRLIRTAARQPA